ncbi:MAG: diaminopimelate epimerase [Fluviicola sp.]|nr:diaminopimelate epimerase [Fluviicola sp.]
MKINFSKYQGTGNDFIMLNNIGGQFDDLSIENIAFLCDRKLGIGADGLIKISSAQDCDFEVDYYNADGSKSFCGNGARCSVLFAKSLGLITEEKTTFVAIDGKHKAFLTNDTVSLEMLPVIDFEEFAKNFIIDTGSPHYVTFEKDKTKNIVEFGKEIRYSERFKKEGINVNSVEVISEDTIQVQTYERGVEDETLSCGTGVTACALLYMMQNPPLRKVKIQTKGGELTVEAAIFSKEKGFRNIWLSGPAKKVFDGSIEL